MALDPNTIPLQIADQILSQPVQPLADPAEYVQARQEARMSRFFENLFAEMAQQESERQAQLQAQQAALAQATPVEEAYESAGIPSAPVNAVAEVLSRATPTFMTPVEEPAAEEPVEPIEPEKKEKKGGGGFWGAVKHAIKEGVEAPFQGIEAGIEATGRAIERVPRMRRVGTAIRSLPEAAAEFKETFGEEFSRKVTEDRIKEYIKAVEKEEGRRLSDEEKAQYLNDPVLLKELGVSFNFVNALRALNDYGWKPLVDKAMDAGEFMFTDASPSFQLLKLLDPVTPDVIDDRIEQAVRFAGRLAPFVALDVLVPGVRIPLDIAFGASAADDAQRLWEQYRNGEIGTREFVVGLGMIALDLLPVGIHGGTMGARALRGKPIAPAAARSREAAESIKGTIEDFRRLSPEEQQAFLRARGLVDEPGQAAADTERGQVKPDRPVFYHGTTTEGAQGILSEGRIRPTQASTGTLPGVYLHEAEDTARISARTSSRLAGSTEAIVPARVSEDLNIAPRHVVDSIKEELHLGDTPADMQRLADELQARGYDAADISASLGKVEQRRIVVFDPAKVEPQGAPAETRVSARTTQAVTPSQRLAAVGAGERGTMRLGRRPEPTPEPDDDIIRLEHFAPERRGTLSPRFAGRGGHGRGEELRYGGPPAVHYYPEGGERERFIRGGQKHTVEVSKRDLLRFSDREAVERVTKRAEELARKEGVAKHGGYVRQAAIELGYKGLLDDMGAMPPARAQLFVEKVPNETADELARRVDVEGGATYEPRSNRFHGAEDGGYAVSMYKDRNVQIPKDEFTPRHIRDYIESNFDVLDENPQNRIGLWHDTDEGIVHLDIVRVLDDKDEALREAAARDEKAIWDFANSEEIYVTPSVREAEVPAEPKSSTEPPAIRERTPGENPVSPEDIIGRSEELTPPEERGLRPTPTVTTRQLVFEARSAKRKISRAEEAVQIEGELMRRAASGDQDALHYFLSPERIRELKLIDKGEKGALNLSAFGNVGSRVYRAGRAALQKIAAALRDLGRKFLTSELGALRLGFPDNGVLKLPDGKTLAKSDFIDYATARYILYRKLEGPEDWAAHMAKTFGGSRNFWMRKGLPEVRRRVDQFVRDIKAKGEDALADLPELMRQLEAGRNIPRQVTTSSGKTIEVAGPVDMSRWYDNTYRRLQPIFGEHTDIFIRFVAAAGANTSPRDSVGYALKAYSQWLAGLPFSGYPNPQIVKGFEAVVLNKPLSGLKIGAYERALLHDPDAFVADRWVFQALGGARAVPSKEAQTRATNLAREIFSRIAEQTGLSLRGTQAAIWGGARLDELKAFGQLRHADNRTIEDVVYEAFREYGLEIPKNRLNDFGRLFLRNARGTKGEQIPMFEDFDEGLSRFNERVRAARNLNKLKEHIDIDGPFDEAYGDRLPEEILQDFETARNILVDFRRRIEYASDSELEEIGAARIPEWQKREAEALLKSRRAGIAEHVPAPLQELPPWYKRYVRERFGTETLPYGSQAQWRDYAHQLSLLDQARTREELEAWITNNKQFVGDVPTWITSAARHPTRKTPRGTPRHIPTPYLEARPFRESTRVLNVERLRADLRDRYIRATGFDPRAQGVDEPVQNAVGLKKGREFPEACGI